MKLKKILCNKAHVCKEKKHCDHAIKHEPIRVVSPHSELGISCDMSRRMCMDTGYDCICEEV